MMSRPAVPVSVSSPLVPFWIEPGAGWWPNALAVHRDVAGADERAIEAGTAVDDVGGAVVGRRVDDVVAVAGVDRVRAPAGPDLVVPDTAVERVIAGTTEEEVGAFVARDGVVAGLAERNVAAALAGDRVVPGLGEDVVAVVGARQRVVAPRPHEKTRGGGGGERKRGEHDQERDDFAHWCSFQSEWLSGSKPVRHQPQCRVV